MTHLHSSLIYKFKARNYRSWSVIAISVLVLLSALYPIWGEAYFPTASVVQAASTSSPTTPFESVAITGANGVVANDTALEAARAPLAACVGGNDLGGRVWRDYNSNGIQEGLESNFDGLNNGPIVVTAYDNVGFVSQVPVDAAGQYRFPDIFTGRSGDRANIRLEFSGLPNWIESSLYQAPDNLTTVQFHSAPTCEANLALQNPDDYCGSNPSLITSCFVFNNDSSGAADDPGTAGVENASIVRFQRNDADYQGDNGVTIGGTGRGQNEYLATIAQTGSTVGLSVYQPLDLIFAGANAKRGTDYGPGFDGILGTADDAGAIYIIDQNNIDTIGALGVLNVPNAGPAIPTPRGIDGNEFGPGGAFVGETCTSIATNPRPISPTVPIEWIRDSCTYDIAGKQSLGDLQINGTGDTLYVVNLFDRHLYSFDVSSGVSATIQTTIQDVGPLYNDGTTTDWPTCPNGEWRPFALEWSGGSLYIGGVCSGENLDPTVVADINVGNADLSAHVFRFSDPAVGTAATQVLSDSLSYLRRSGGDTPLAPVLWQPWTSTLFDHQAWGQQVLGQSVQIGAPILADMAIDATGHMLLAFRDRTGDQHYSNSYSPGVDESGSFDASQFLTGGATDTYGLYSNGDLRRACPTATGWEMEGSATCLPQSGATVQEFFASDAALGNFNPPVHTEVFQGGLALLPGTGEVAAISMDPNDQLHSGGVRFFSATVASTSYESYEIFDQAALNLGRKGNGLGDLEYVCEAGPLELGNYVWVDANANGVQEPHEVPLGFIDVVLTDSTGMTYTTQTNASGQYYFNNSNVPGGIQTSSPYTITIDMTQPRLVTYTLTTPNVNSGSTLPDSVDSDATMIGSLATLTITTGTAGQTDHSLDFGAYQEVLIGNQVWIEDDNDGNAATGVITPVIGTVVTATAANGTIYTGTTNATGFYTITVPANSVYTVTVGTPPGFSVAVPAGGLIGTDSDPNTDNQLSHNPSGTVVTVGTVDNLTIDFGFYMQPPLRLGNFVWSDTNNNGQVDPGEPARGGVVVNLLDENGLPYLNPSTGVAMTTTTNASGNYLFEGLLPGTYIVEIPAENFDELGDPLFGFVSSLSNLAVDPTTDPDVDTTDNDDNGLNGTDPRTDGVRSLPITLEPNGEPNTDAADEDGSYADDNSNLTVDFGFFELMSLGNQIWFDGNNNGVFDPSETAAPAGIILYLLDGNGTPIVDLFTGQPVSVTTSVGGLYLFTYLFPGNYQVQIGPENFAPGGPIADYTSSTGSVDPDNDSDRDDNGSDPVDVTISGIFSNPITLAYNTETVNNEDGDGNSNTNNTVDFGLIAAPNAVELISFTAVRSGISSIEVRWVTGAEIDNFGFRLMRSTDSNLTNATQVHFESSVVTTGPGASYSFVDSNLKPNTYTYWLIDVETDGDATVNGPISFTLTRGYQIYLPLAAR